MSHADLERPSSLQRSHWQRRKLSRLFTQLQCSGHDLSAAGLDYQSAHEIIGVGVRKQLINELGEVSVRYQLIDCRRGHLDPCLGAQSEIEGNRIVPAIANGDTGIDSTQLPTNRSDEATQGLARSHSRDSDSRNAEPDYAPKV